MSQRALLGIALLAFGFTSIAHGQAITILNNDGAGEGFNDPTPRVSDINGAATTLGQDRLNCFAAAAQVWADYLSITIPVVVDAQFSQLGGSAFGAILGFAGPTNVVNDFVGTPIPGMLFVAAQANQLAGTDLTVGAEIATEFNADVDDPFVLGSISWYYGIDGNTPPNTIDFFSTAMHEIGHGLGFLSLMDNSSGALFGGFMDIYTNQLRQLGTDYTAMSDAQRAIANVSNQVVWKGSSVIASQGFPQPIYSPSPLQQGSSISHWDVSATPNLLMEPFATDSFTGLTLEREAFADMLWPVSSSSGSLTDAQVSVSLYRDTMSSADRAIYDEIFGHFADAVFEATNQAVGIYEVKVFQDGEPVFEKPPRISITNENPIHLDVGETYFEFGATAIDSIDGNVTSDLLISGSVNTARAGEYSVVYSVTDSAGLLSRATRRVVVHGRPPVIVVQGRALFANDNPVYITVGSQYIQAPDPDEQPTAIVDAGVIALDISDGNITELVVTSGFPSGNQSIDTSTEGTRVITYSVTDSNGSTAVAQRSVRVVAADSDIPQITILGSNPIFMDINQDYSDAGATATDLTDGNITGSIVRSGEVLVNFEGVYEIEYSVTDSEGETETATRVVVVRGIEPEIHLVGSNPVNIEIGSSYADQGAFAVEDSPMDVFVSGNVNPATPGTYIISYFGEDAANNFAFASRVVNVIGTLDQPQLSDIMWLRSGVPSLSYAGGIGTAGGSVVMYDIFEGGEAGEDLDLLAPENRRIAGYILASLFLQWSGGVGTEFAESAADIAVANSILADPFSPASAPSGFGLNVSSTQDGVATGGVFAPLEDTQATAQYRLHGASAWATAVRPVSEDPKPKRLVAKRPRSFNPLLASVAPEGEEVPATDLGSLPTGNFSGARFVNAGGVPFTRSFVRLATENTLPLVAGSRVRSAANCLPGRHIDVDVEALGPLVFRFPVDPDLRELVVVIATPCIGGVANLDVTLTDAIGRIINPLPVDDPAVLKFRATVASPGLWQMRMSARTFKATGVQIDVYGEAGTTTHRASLSLVRAPAASASSFIQYPTPVVLIANDTSGLPISGATVKATVTTPTGKENALAFVDNGSGVDLVANDGMYSANMPYTQNGLYTVELSISDTNGTSDFTLKGTSRAPTLGFLGPEFTPEPGTIPVGDPYIRGIITSFSVGGLEADDHGDGSRDATNVPLTSVDVPGRIDSPNDLDYFTFTVAARGATEDIVARLTDASDQTAYRMRLLDSSGLNVIANGAIGPAGYPQIEEALPSGVYLLEVTAPGAQKRTSYSVSAGAAIPSDVENVGIEAAASGSGGGGGGGGGGGCFIATAAYGTPLETEIDQLRAVRDEQMLGNALGAAFANAYYRLSPPVADVVAQNAVLRDAVRGGINAVLAVINLDTRAIAVIGAIAMALAAAGARRARRNRA